MPIDLNHSMRFTSTADVSTKIIFESSNTSTSTSTMILKRSKCTSDTLNHCCYPSPSYAPEILFWYHYFHLTWYQQPSPKSQSITNLFTSTATCWLLNPFIYISDIHLCTYKLLLGRQITSFGNKSIHYCISSRITGRRKG